MNSTSRLPREQVDALRPGDVKLYLTSKGWLSEKNVPQTKAMTFHHPGNGVEIQLPIERSLGDYLLRMGDVVVALARVEDRPVPELLNDLSMPPGDIFRFRVADPVAALGQLPLAVGIKLLQGGRDLFWSSATSLQHPAALHPLRTNRKVNAFLRECRLGQTERGSFVATILAPVPPVIETQKTLFDSEATSESEPFARRVTTRLISSLGIVSDAIRSDTPDRILDGVSQGVSANLCEALVAMEPPGDQSHLDIQVTWARSRPSLPPNIPSIVSFPKENFAIIKEAGRQLRARASAKRERYEGPVLSVQKALRSLFDNVAGRMILAADVGGVRGRVKVDLAEEDFIRACDALRDRHHVAVTGIIRNDVKARQFELSEPSKFQVLNDEKVT